MNKSAQSNPKPETKVIPICQAEQSPAKPASAEQPLPLKQKLQVHNTVVHRIRQVLQADGYDEIPVPELTAATGSCEVVDSMFSLDYFGALAFPRQTGQLYLEEMIDAGLDAVYCEGESLRKEWKVDQRHLTEFKLIEIERKNLSLDGLCDLQEAMVKDVGAHLLETATVGVDHDRCERMLTAEHPRLSYREALVLLNKHGWSLDFGDDLMREWSVVIAPYGDGETNGTVAVLGPTRMPYQRSIPRVRYVASLMSSLLHEVR